MRLKARSEEMLLKLRGYTSMQENRYLATSLATTILLAYKRHSADDLDHTRFVLPTAD